MSVSPRPRRGWLVEPAHEKKGEPFDPNRLMAEAVGQELRLRAAELARDRARACATSSTGVSRVIFVFFITLMLAAYMMLDARAHRGVLPVARRARAGAPSFDALLARIDSGLSGVVRGQLVICGINGVLSGVGFAIVGLKYWPVMALVAALFSLVPIFGSIASAVPAVAIGLTQGLGTASFVLFWIVGIHQLEANVLNPKIMGDAAKIHPVLVIFSLLAGEHFFRVRGAARRAGHVDRAERVPAPERGNERTSNRGDAMTRAGSANHPASAVRAVRMGRRAPESLQNQAGFMRAYEPSPERQSAASCSTRGSSVSIQYSAAQSFPS